MAKAILRVGPEVVGLASIWPRQKTRFNKKIKELEKIMNERLYGNPQITYWRSASNMATQGNNIPDFYDNVDGES